MKVTGAYKTCLDRQEAEAVKVRRAQLTVDILMNSRKDFHQPPIRRLVPMTGNTQGRSARSPYSGPDREQGTWDRGQGLAHKPG
jgi:hypothetical protein